MSDRPSLPDGFAVVGHRDHGVFISTDGDRALTPEQARELARQLVEAADAADANPAEECPEHPGEPCIIGGPYANHAW